MNILRKGFLVTAAAVTLAFSAAGSAQAHAYADSILNINNLVFVNSAGTQYALSDFSTLVVNNTRLATATVGSLPPPLSNAAGPICVGACPAVPLVPRFGEIPVPGVLSTFGYGDTELAGSAITPGGATAQTRATASVASGSDTASGNANTGTTTSFVFSLDAADSITVEFTADAHTLAHTPAGATDLSVANARLSWSIQIVDLLTNTSVLSYSPGQINGNSLVSRTHALTGTSEYDFAGFLTATSDVLVADRTYQLTIQHNTFADALQEEVPEPATLAIIAAGMLSMSLVNRRRKS